MTGASSILRLHPADNVAVALRDLAPDDPLPGTGVKVSSAVPLGHKVALASIRSGEPIVKCGHPIGLASGAIPPGSHVHIHNVSELPGRFAPETEALHAPPGGHGNVNVAQRTFPGIRRPDGRAGTRNYVGVLTTVNCSATAARRIAAAFSAPGALADFPNIDGVVAFTHPTGCAMDRAGEGYAVLERVTRGYLSHPNFGAVLLIGLGCEVNQGDAYGRVPGDGRPFEFFNIQDSGGTSAAITEGVARVRAMLPQADRMRREPLPLGGLSVGLQCGGSDAFSVISTNPALGRAVDMITEWGGTAILSETPEVASGADGLLRRCAGTTAADALRGRFRWWEEYTRRHGTVLEKNPAPGNIAGGITTLAEKALGAIAKGGAGPIMEVREYAEPVRGPGLVFMDSPGFDPVSATGQIASGANLICFTTGRGSTFGSLPAPCIKLASNTRLYRHMQDDMDLNCGTIVDGSATLDDIGALIAETMLRVAGGARTKSELLGLGENEFAPWILGAVL
ncbi:MAG: altronate dehydratase [Gammaproteobacteria bacterium]|nr:altronate dehydratase [Gammaproteobacteria bacterium]